MDHRSQPAIRELRRTASVRNEPLRLFLQYCNMYMTRRWNASRGCGSRELIISSADGRGRLNDLRQANAPVAGDRHGPTDEPDAPSNPFPDNRPGAEAITFGRQGNRLVAEDLGGVAAAARLGPSGPEVRLRLPAGYDHADAFFTVAWLDDDRVVLMADNKDDLLVCRLPHGRCRAAVKGPLYADFGGRG